MRNYVVGGVLACVLKLAEHKPTSKYTYITIKKVERNVPE